MYPKNDHTAIEQLSSGATPPTWGTGSGDDDFYSRPGNGWGNGNGYGDGDGNGDGDGDGWGNGDGWSSCPYYYHEGT